jgi:hypothetical protein
MRVLRMRWRLVVFVTDERDRDQEREIRRREGSKERLPL